mmetsp:Transcript_1987/g.4377  ORF Transcript_1987/g.4377 Transcript_1987/m.4377 type:complete len:245 (+) Transcript_1987:424-1158(+)
MHRQTTHRPPIELIQHPPPVILLSSCGGIRHWLVGCICRWFVVNRLVPVELRRLPLGHQVLVLAPLLKRHSLPLGLCEQQWRDELLHDQREVVVVVGLVVVDATGGQAEVVVHFGLRAAQAAADQKQRDTDVALHACHELVEAGESSEWSWGVVVLPISDDDQIVLLVLVVHRRLVNVLPQVCCTTICRPRLVQAARRQFVGVAVDEPAVASAADQMHIGGRDIESRLEGLECALALLQPASAH